MSVPCTSTVRCKCRQQHWYIYIFPALFQNSFAEDSDGATLQFKCLEQEGRITTCRNELGEIDQVLTINGILIE